MVKTGTSLATGEVEVTPSQLCRVVEGVGRKNPRGCSSTISAARSFVQRSQWSPGQ